VWRGVWLFVGVLCGALGYVMGAAVFPDTINGLFLGGVVPILLGAVVTTWSRQPTALLCTVLGAGALAGVYATRFNLDPQSLNYSLPVGVGQTLFPLGLGFLTAALLGVLLPDEPAAPATAAGAAGASGADRDATASEVAA
jgi:hypothetical protein